MWLMGIWHELYVRLMAALLYLAINLVCPLLRFQIWRHRDFFETKQRQNVLFAVWHQATFVMFYLYRGRQAVLLVTAETRGQILSHCARWLGYRPIPIPTGKQDLYYVKGLADIIKQIKAGHDAVVAVDGPAGPLFAVKPGALYLAQKAGVPIVPVGVKAPFKLTLSWRWDRYFVPLPFSPVRVRLGRAFPPGKNAVAELKRKLTRLAR
jgi:lysophospholipid acyltransferase (LPLAT)-like uncharacterized protein